MIIAAAAFTPNGIILLDRIERIFANGHEMRRFEQEQERARNWLEREFRAADAVIIVGAAGIAVRLLSGLPQSKTSDPAVLVLDEAGRFVIPLLSGHIGGANKLAEELAQALDATAVITTATDINGLFSVDTWATEHNCALPEPRYIKDISAALLRGKPVGFSSEFPVRSALADGDLPVGLCKSGPGETGTEGNALRVGIHVGLSVNERPFPATLAVVPRIAALGAGCRKGVAPEAFAEFVSEGLREYDIYPEAVFVLASIDLKQEEPCLLAFAEERGIPFRTFSATELAAAPGLFSASAFVEQVAGVDNVCERAAVLAAGGRLRIRKKSRDGMTMALALTPWVCSFE